MINATKDKLVFIQTGAQLNVSIITGLKLASAWILRAYGLEELDLERVNTKSYHQAIVPALVDEFILRNKDTVFSEEYVLAAFELVSTELTEISPELYSRLTIAQTFGKRAYRKTYFESLRRGFSAFLIALHTRRAIVLPHGFTWPLGLNYGKKGKILSRREICPLDELPELLRFVRSLDDKTDTLTESVFIPSNRSERKRLSYYALHLITATGWLTPDEANYDDLFVLYEVNEKNRFVHGHLSCFMLADILERKYRSRSPITAAGWQAHLTKARVLLRNPDFGESLHTNIGANSAILEQAVNIGAIKMAPENLAMLIRLPGLDSDVAAMTQTWLTLENTYLRKIGREDDKGRLTAIGHLNAYLFAYLPYWFAAHPTFPHAFPDCPNKLLGAVFISDLGLLDHLDKPVTLVDFIATVSKNRKWEGPTHYRILRQLFVFFTFLERFRDQLPGCAGFQQPLSPHDFPPTSRACGTRKRPIPRRLFKFYISYTEALVAHAEALLNRILSGAVPDSQMSFLKTPRAVTIDCFQLQELFGFIPVVFHRGKMIPLRRIPNVLCIDRKNLKDGRTLRIPHLHSLRQILVALYTGLRHNHIQWLDAETFDCLVGDEPLKRDYAELHVNTDKAKTKPWQPYVNSRVIEILREQLAWRQLIGELGFANKVFYNNNPKTKWGQFYPLFSSSADGKPHSDAAYTSVWHCLLSGVQGMLPEIGESELQLVRLLPSPVPYADPNQAQKLYEYGGQQKRICQLMLKSDITPHSARVSVVSHSISILPADLIGRYRNCKADTGDGQPHVWTGARLCSPHANDKGAACKTGSAVQPSDRIHPLRDRARTGRWEKSSRLARNQASEADAGGRLGR